MHRSPWSTQSLCTRQPGVFLFSSLAFSSWQSQSHAKTHKDSQRLGATQRTIWAHCGAVLTFFPLYRVKWKNHPESLRVGVAFLFPPSLTHWIYSERRGEGGRWRKLLCRGDYRQRGAWRDIPGPHISFATSDFQIKWAQSAGHNEIFLIDFPESVHHHQPSPISGMSELGRCWQICHWCMRPGKIQRLLAWQCWPGLSINEE